MNPSTPQNNSFCTPTEEPFCNTSGDQHLAGTAHMLPYGHSSSLDPSNGQTTFPATVQNPYASFGMHLFPTQGMAAVPVSPIPANTSMAAMIDRRHACSPPSAAHVTYPYRRVPKSNQDAWTAEQDEFICRGKHEKKTIPTIAEGLFHTFGVVRTPNVISKRWAKIRGRCVNEDDLTALIQNIMPPTLERFNEELSRLGYASARLDNRHDALAGVEREVQEKLKKGLSKLLQDAVLTLQRANQAS